MLNYYAKRAYIDPDKIPKPDLDTNENCACGAVLTNENKKKFEEITIVMDKWLKKDKTLKMHHERN